MSDKKRLIKTTVRFEFDMTSTWPDSYEGMTFEEALAHERQLGIEDHIEALHDASPLRHEASVKEVFAPVEVDPDHTLEA